jgi:hypothetical protein
MYLDKAWSQICIQRLDVGKTVSLLTADYSSINRIITEGTIKILIWNSISVVATLLLVPIDHDTSIVK